MKQFLPMFVFLLYPIHMHT